MYIAKYVPDFKLKYSSISNLMFCNLSFIEGMMT